jgi:thioredoxin 1
MNIQKGETKKEDNMIHTFTDSNLDTHIKSGELLVVDFWADWCSPCRFMGPVIRDVASKLPDVKVGKLDVDENQNSANAHDIMSIPTIVIFKGGLEVDRISGVVSAETLINSIKKYI